MTKTFLLAIIWAFCQASLASAGDPLIISGHPEYPPITWQEGDTLVGVGVQLAKSVFAEIGVTYEIKATGPWKRVHKNAKYGRIDVIAATYMNPEREKYLVYTSSFMKDPVSIFVMKGKTFPFEKWEDLIGKTGNTALGESYGNAFDLFMEQKLRVDKTPTVMQNFLKLELGRVDYAIIGLYPGLSYACNTGFKDKIEVLSTPVLEEDFYMAFSKGSSYAHLLPQVNKIIARLKDEGRIDFWIRAYLAYYQSNRH